jgi:DNA-binding PadR family transcriptional regulator
MGRKPKPGLRETILAEAATQPSSATMICAALEKKYGPQSPTLTGVIKAAESLRSAGLLQTSKMMPEVYHGSRPRTYYMATPKGAATLKNVIASATANWNGSPPHAAAKCRRKQT